MIINANSLLPQLKEKVRSIQSDTSRHLICPHCAIRTKLNTLGDGRKKCTVCGRKFRIHKVTEGNKLQQCAEILLCFCLDFSAYKTAHISHHRHRLVAVYYEHFRKLIAEKGLPHKKNKFLYTYKGKVHRPHSASRCQWCKSKILSAAGEGQPPVFGIQLRESGEVYIDPLKDDEAVLHFHMFGSKEKAVGRRHGYAGFICCGKFHRLTKEENSKDGAGQLWMWIRERAHTHRGIWKRNTGFFLKELEWKYNHQSLAPELQAQKIIEMIPADFLASWFLKTEGKSTAIK